MIIPIGHDAHLNTVLSEDVNLFSFPVMLKKKVEGRAAQAKHRK